MSELNPSSTRRRHSFPAAAGRDVCASGSPTIPSIARSPCADGLSRKVYCVLGMPIDAIDMTDVLQKIEDAAAGSTPFLISTPNVNFLVTCKSDGDFRESVLSSDLCPADGMPIVWAARLLGLPIKKRISGADIFEALKAPRSRRVSVFFFGGLNGVATKAAQEINATSAGLICVGSLDPGCGSLDEMSANELVDQVNRSGADFLAVSLGAKKGQRWLLHNHERLTVPVRAHLGAVVNFQAGTLRRAPSAVRVCGLEWLWRIKEEPHLWSRYAGDGATLIRLLLTRLLPLMSLTLWQRLRWRACAPELQSNISRNSDTLLIRLSGLAVEAQIESTISCFQNALGMNESHVSIDLAGVKAVDARFLGLLILFRKELTKRKKSLSVVGVSRTVERMFLLNDLKFLVSSGPGEQSLHRSRTGIDQLSLIGTSAAK